jgi:hypothetical protein
MTKVIQEIEPFKCSYIVKNLLTKRMISADTIGEAIWLAEHELMHPVYWKDIKSFDIKKYFSTSFTYEGVYPLVMTDNLGAIIHPNEICCHQKIPPVHNSTPKWWVLYYKREAALAARRLMKKGNPDKVKFRYSVTEYTDTLGDISYNAHLHHYRPIRTTQERRMAIAHGDEYGMEFVRGRRSFRGLPSSWDDYCSGVWSLQNSWKHHSKRQKQWKCK